LHRMVFKSRRRGPLWLYPFTNYVKSANQFSKSNLILTFKIEALKKRALN